jgi:hypothetical protein
VAGGDPVGELGDEVGGEARGAGLVVLGLGLGEHPGAGGGVLDRDLHDCLFDAQRALDEVEVAGLEGDEFSPPESGVDGGLHKQPMLGGKGGEDGDVLLRIQRPGLLLDDLGELGVGAGVER